MVSEYVPVLLPVLVQGPEREGAVSSTPPLKVSLRTPFTSVSLVITASASTKPPTNAADARMSVGARTIPPRLLFAVMVTLAARVKCRAQSVPLDGGTAAGTVGSHSAPNSSVTPLEFSPGSVSLGLSAGTANGLY